jgi:hypothetical protein
MNDAPFSGRNYIMKIGFCLYFLLQPTLAGTFSQ